MKTTRKTAALLFAASLSLAGITSAAEQRTTASEARHRAEAPLRFAGRAGRSIFRSPLIVGETLTGERRFMSKDGLMAAGEKDAAPAEQSQISIPTGRGERIPIFVEKE